MITMDIRPGGGHLTFLTEEAIVSGSYVCQLIIGGNVDSTSEAVAITKAGL